MFKFVIIFTIEKENNSKIKILSEKIIKIKLFEMWKSLIFSFNFTEAKIWLFKSL